MPPDNSDITNTLDLKVSGFVSYFNQLLVRQELPPVNSIHTEESQLDDNMKLSLLLASFAYSRGSAAAQFIFLDVFITQNPSISSFFEMDMCSFVYLLSDENKQKIINMYNSFQAVHTGDDLNDVFAHLYKVMNLLTTQLRDRNQFRLRFDHSYTPHQITTIPQLFEAMRPAIREDIRLRQASQTYSE